MPALIEDRGQRHRGERLEGRCEREKERDEQPAGDQADHLGLAAACIVDDRARLAGADRESLEQTGSEVGGGERDEFLVGPDLVTVLGAESAGDQNGVGERQQGDGQRAGEQGADIVQRSRGQPRLREPLRHLADDLHAARWQVEHEGDAHRQDADDERARGLRRDAPEHFEDRDESGAEDKREPVRFAEPAEQFPQDREEISSDESDAEELPELRGGEDQGGAAHVSDEDGLGEEFGDDADAEHGGQEQDRASEQRYEGGQAHRARDVARDQRADGAGQEQREGGIGARDDLARTGEEGVADHAGEGGVQPVLGWEAGEFRVGQDRRDHHDADTDAGDEIGTKPGAPDSRGARRRWEPTWPGKPCGHGSRRCPRA